MPRWRVEIASRPGMYSEVFDETYNAIRIAVDDAVACGLLIRGRSDFTTEGRVGGDWTIECATASQAGTLASDLVNGALDSANVRSDECVVDVLRIEPDRRPNPLT